MDLDPFMHFPVLSYCILRSLQPYHATVIGAFTDHLYRICTCLCFSTMHYPRWGSSCSKVASRNINYMCSTRSHLQSICLALALNHQALNVANGAHLSPAAGGGGLRQEADFESYRPHGHATERNDTGVVA